MTPLIDRLETEEGSRELSDAVLLACGWKRKNCGGGVFGGAIHWTQPDGVGFWGHNRTPPDPARNVQDGIDWVVPEGWSYEVRCSHYGNMAKAEVWEGRDPTPYTGAVNSPAPERALCIAGLRARDALKAREKIDG